MVSSLTVRKNACGPASAGSGASSVLPNAAPDALPGVEVDPPAHEQVEADHVIGDLIARGKARAPAVERPHLAIAYRALKAYEARLAMGG